MRSEASTSWAAVMAPALAAWLAVPIWVSDEEEHHRDDQARGA
jgi:hypothetical protein